MGRCVADATVTAQSRHCPLLHSQTDGAFPAGVVQALELAPNALVGGAALSAHAHGAKWREAIELLGQLSRGEAAPRTAAYNEVLAACVRDGAWGSALDVYSKMERKGTPRDQVTIGLAAQARARPAARSPTTSLPHLLRTITLITPTTRSPRSPRSPCFPRSPP